jgi:propanol-preferring alcohol dehydrogenase
MIGNQRDGGYAERIVIPERNLVAVPDEVALTHAAVMMCSSVTALHALRRARLVPGERVAVFGAGGLGMSAIQLAVVLGADEVLAVDIDEGRLEAAAELGAIPIDAGAKDPVGAIRESGGVDVAVELVGSSLTTEQALGSLRPLGRAAVAGLTDQTTPVPVYDRLMSQEAELIGVMDHTMDEAQEVVAYAAAGALDVSALVTATVPLDAAVVDARFDHLEKFGAGIRTVITVGDASPD